MLGLPLSAGCSGAPPQIHASQDSSGGGSPLGPSYVLIPVPSDDEALLGRVLQQMPEEGRSLEETSRPNECADKLAAPKTSPLANSFEDAQELSMSGGARAMLGTFGFEADVKTASHFYYKLTTDKRIARSDTVEYTQCCAAKKTCGIGYVAALIAGEGEYATGVENSASGSITVPVAGGAGGETRLKVLHKRKVKGWLAALVNITDPQQAKRLGPLGLAAEAGIQDTSMPEQVKDIYEKNKISIQGAGREYTFQTGSGQVLTENEFARRFNKATGTNELAAADRRRNPTSFAISGALTALSLGLTVYSAMNLKRNCTGDDATFDENCEVDKNAPGAVCYNKLGNGDPFFCEYYNPNNKTENTAGYIGLVAGGLMTAGFGTWFLIAAFKGDGSPDNHVIEDDDARLFVARYNRALLRNTVRNVQRSNTSRLYFTPLLSPGFNGGSLRFTF